MLSKNFKELMKLLVTFKILHVSHRNKIDYAVKYYPAVYTVLHNP